MDKDLITLIRLLTRRSFITLFDVETVTDSTRRQVMYRLDKLNTLLADEGLLPVVIGNQKEFLIDPNSRDFFIQFLYEITDEVTYILNREERIIYIYLLLFINREYLSLQHFISALQISKSTILQDLRVLGEELKREHIYLKNDRVRGYYLEGSEMEQRRTMMRFVFLCISEHRNTHVLDRLIDDEHLETFAYSKLVIEELAETFQISFVVDRLTEFIYIFILLKTRIIEGMQEPWHDYNLPKLDMMRSFKEYIFTENLINFYPSHDKISPLDRMYMSSWVIGISFGDVEETTEDVLIIGQIVGKIMTRFELLSGVHYRNSEKIFRHIYSHFRPAYYRLLFRLPVYNPLRDRVMEEYPDLYALVRETMKPFGAMFADAIDEDELTYLTMHFASIYSQKKNTEPLKRQKALIVCLNGIGSSVILYNELRSFFPEIDFYLPIEVADFDIKEFPADIIFTTKYFKDLQNVLIPVIKVNPVMDANERYSLMREVSVHLKTTTHPYPTMESIQSILRNHIGVTDNEAQLIEELMNTFVKAYDVPADNEVHNITLRDMVDESMIALNIDASDTIDALSQSGRLLVDAGRVEPRYVDAVINSQRLHPGYYVVAPHIALPHTSHKHGSKSHGLGIVSLKNPLYFGNFENDPVQYIFFLSATDNESHIGAMSQLLELMNIPEFLKLLNECEDPKAVIDYIENLS